MTDITQQEIADTWPDTGRAVLNGFRCRCGLVYDTQRELLDHFTRRPNPTHQAAHAADGMTAAQYEEWSASPED